jgi:ABC-type hemin transport system substrate-binding protein
MPFKFVPKQNMSPEETLNKISETLDNINQTLQQTQTNQQLTPPTQRQIDWEKI